MTFFDVNLQYFFRVISHRVPGPISKVAPGADDSHTKDIVEVRIIYAILWVAHYNYVVFMMLTHRFTEVSFAVVVFERYKRSYLEGSGKAVEGSRRQWEGSGRQRKCIKVYFWILPKNHCKVLFIQNDHALFCEETPSLYGVCGRNEHTCYFRAPISIRKMCFLLEFL